MPVAPAPDHPALPASEGWPALFDPESVRGDFPALDREIFTILEQDPRTVDPMALTKLQVSATIIGGETAYEG